MGDHGNIFRLGTRSSALALYQANQVAERLAVRGYRTEIVKVDSRGDLDKVTPLAQIGAIGVFTKSLDQALTSGRIDMAVHSLKDYPTTYPDGISLSACMPRANPLDVLVSAGSIDELYLRESAQIATGSVRRAAQWRYKFRGHTIVNIRGNVPTRLDKITTSPDYDAGILAAAGLERLGIAPANTAILDWMTPAPAQGVIGVTCRTEDTRVRQAGAEVSHGNSTIAANIERIFLSTLEGGCAAPIGALARQQNGKWSFEGRLNAPDGSQQITVDGAFEEFDWALAGKSFAEKCLAQGGRQIIDKLRNYAP